jgi:hypothetical protein
MFDENSPTSVWKSILEQVRPHVNIQTFNTWLKPTRLDHNGDSQLSVFAPTLEHCQWIQENYHRLLLEKAADFGIKAITYVPEEVPAQAPSLAPRDEEEIPVVSRAAPTIPEECWRGIFADYRDIARRAGEAPDAFHFAGIAAALSAGLGKSVCMRDPVEVWPNLYLCVVGEAGCGKTEPIKFGIRTVLRQAVPTVPELNSLDSAQGLISAIKRRGNSAPSIAITLTEIRSLIEKSAQKSSGDLIPKLNDLYDCVPRLEINTRHSFEDMDNPPPAVFLAATTSEWMEKAKREDLSGGLGSRIIFVPGDPRRGARPKPQDFGKVACEVREIVNFWKSKGESELRFDADAEAAYWRWHDNRPTIGCRHRLIQTMSVRHRSYVLKFAMLYAAMDRSVTITLQHVQSSLAFVSKFAFPALWHLFSDFNLSPFGKLEEKIIDTVKAHGNRGLRVKHLIDSFKNGQFDRWMIRRAIENVAGRFADDPSWDGDLKLVTLGRKRYVQVNDD